MTARSGDEVWKRRIELWERAWYWAYASVFVARRPRSEMEQRLEGSLAEARSTRARHASTLTSELAWGWCMSRMAGPPDEQVLATARLRCALDLVRSPAPVVST